MDGSAFDTLARSFAHSGTRRRLLTLLLALPLGGVLTTLGGDEAAAQQRPIDRIQRRTPQRNRKQRNKNKNNNNKNNTQNKNQNTNQTTGQSCGNGLCQGCCAGGICEAGDTAAQCGTFGGGAAVNCQTCATGQDCRNGLCVCTNPSCSNGACDCNGSCCPDARQICGSLYRGSQSCCYPNGTRGVCTADNFAQVCCSTNGTLVSCDLATGTCSSPPV